MALYAPFYAGKNAPLKAKVATKKSTPAKSMRKTLKSRKSECSNAARTMAKCRNKKFTLRSICKTAGKTLYGCRKKN